MFTMPGFSPIPIKKARHLPARLRIEDENDDTIDGPAAPE